MRFVHFHLLRRQDSARLLDFAGINDIRDSPRRSSPNIIDSIHHCWNSNWNAVDPNLSAASGNESD
jgi:hypothetical protein